MRLFTPDFRCRGLARSVRVTWRIWTLAPLIHELLPSRSKHVNIRSLDLVLSHERQEAPA